MYVGACEHSRVHTLTYRRVLTRHSCLGARGMGLGPAFLRRQTMSTQARNGIWGHCLKDGGKVCLDLSVSILRVFGTWSLSMRPNTSVLCFPELGPRPGICWRALSGTASEIRSPAVVFGFVLFFKEHTDYFYHNG